MTIFKTRAGQVYNLDLIVTYGPSPDGKTLLMYHAGDMSRAFPVSDPDDIDDLKKILAVEMAETRKAYNLTVIKAKVGP